MSKKIAIFCGSTFGNDESLKASAIKTSSYLAQSGFDLVYGGGYRGLMGAIADAFKENGKEVIGVLPEIFNKDSVLTKDVHTSLIITKDMHERKATMYSLSDAFVIFPGGIGTLEEFFEVFTWRQIGIHKKTVVLYNLNGFYDTLLSFLTEVTNKGFMASEVLKALKVASNEEEILNYLKEEVEELPSKI